MAKFAKTIEYVNKVIEKTFPFDKLPVWIRRRKFTAHLRTTLFTQLYKARVTLFFWQEFMIPFYGDLAEPASGDGVRMDEDGIAELAPSKDVLKEMLSLKKESLDKLLPEFLSSF